MDNTSLDVALQGSQGSVEATVTDVDTALSLGSGDLPVLGTPRVVALMEAAAVSAIGRHIEDSQTTVGIGLDVRHTAPTSIGAVVRASAEVVQVSDRRITFEVVAACDGHEIAHGRHVRALVDRAAFLDRVRRSIGADHGKPRGISIEEA